MAFASLLGGMALANAGLGAVHGFAAPVGGMFPAPHGAVCAAILPHAMRVNIRAVGERQSWKLARFDEIARLLTGRPHAIAPDAASWLREICARLEIPPLRAYGVSQDDVPALVEKASQASSMKGNPLVLTGDELREILSAAI
jgi:alcohol dehydrogenase class IV